jgi:hypothetical protein
VDLTLTKLVPGTFQGCSWCYTVTGFMSNFSSLITTWRNMAYRYSTTDSRAKPCQIWSP